MTELLGSLAVRGKAGAAVGRELDAVRTLGPRLYRKQAKDSTASKLAGAGRAAVYRRIWEEAAVEVGAELREYPTGYLELSRGNRVVRLWRHLTPVDDPVTLQLAGDKPAAHELLTRAGISVPPHTTVAVSELDAAVGFVRGHERCVVKPASSTGAGNGVTGAVRDRADLLRARLRAARFDSERLLLERQVEGDEYRVLVFDGEVLGVVRRLPPRVTGDDTSSIAELAERENERRRTAVGEAGLWPIRLDLDAVLALREQGLTVRSSPPRGTVVRVKNATSEGSERDATAIAIDDPAVGGIAADAVRAARALGVRLASVELIAPAAANAAPASDGVVLEVNTTPGLAQHYLVANPGATEPVAVKVLRGLFEG